MAVLRVLPVGFGVCINASIDDLPSIVPEKPHSPNEFFTGSKLGFYATPLMFRMMKQLFFRFNSFLIIWVCFVVPILVQYRHVNSVFFLPVSMFNQIKGAK